MKAPCSSSAGPPFGARCPACFRLLREIIGEAPTCVEVDGVWGCSDCYDTRRWDPRAAAARLTISIEIPIRTYSEANSRSHNLGRWKRASKQRDDAALMLRSAFRGGQEPALPVRVTLTRIAPAFLDDDNLPSSLKAVRDQVAVEFGLPLRKAARGQRRPVADDRDPRVTWSCKQERRGMDYAVRVTIESIGGGGQKAQ